MTLMAATPSDDIVGPQPVRSRRLTSEAWFRELTERSARVAIPGVFGAHLRPAVLGRAVIERPRLDRLFAEATQARLVVTTGPAGAGKSTLLCQWLQSDTDAHRIGWLSLQPSHNSPARFWTGLVAALRVAGADVFAHVEPDEIAELVRRDDVVADLVSGLDRLDDPVTVVIDDYHVITHDSIHHGLVDLLEAAPAGLRVAVASRTHPPLRLSRQRARHDLVEIPYRELAFTLDEIGDVLRDSFGPVDSAVALRLFEATEGWPAMVALASQIADDVAELDELLERDLAANRWLADYIVDELVDVQPPARRQFLLDTAVLAELSADLCDTVRDSTDSWRHLESLDRRELLVGLDSSGTWWRHHHLVGELLLRRARVELGERVCDLHSRAADWFAARDRHAETVDHALAAGRYDLACVHMVPALRRPGPAAAPGNETRWFDELPDDVLIRERELLTEIALYVRIVGTQPQRDRLHALTIESERRCGGSVSGGELTGAAPGDWRVVLGLDLSSAAEKIDRLLDSDQSLIWRRLLPGLGVMSRLGLGDVRGAQALALRWIDAPDPVLRRTMDGFLSIIQHHLGDFEGADAAIEACAGAYQGTIADLPLGWARALQARRRGDVDGVRRHFEVARHWSGPQSWPPALIGLDEIEALVDLGAESCAAARLDELVRLLDDLSDPGVLSERAVGLAARLGRPGIDTDPRRAHARNRGLSDREIDVLIELASDRSLREIADSLYVSHNTVKSHTRAVYRKLDVAGRDEAMALLTAWVR